MSQLTILCSPTYAFGMVLEPADEATEWVRAFNFIVPEKFWYFPLAVQLEIYEKYFDWLEDNEFIRKSNDAPTIVPIVDWLHTQRVVSKHFRTKNENDRICYKAELINEFIEQVFNKDYSC